ncbi:peptidylprolyl isomerase [Roseivirga echinicomitans]|nr:peptidylprolyl isomerase [Roseivirga echinicomitans]
MKRTFLFAFLMLTSFFGLKAQVVNIEIKTELGSIMAELYPDKAPITVANFIKYIENHKFDSASFYRTVRMDNQPNNDVKIEVIQGGISYNRSVTSFPAIAHETTEKTGILHTDGVLSMARVGPGTATAEFFVCIGDQPSLDFGGKRNPDGQGFATFGKVTKGMDIVKKIQQKEDKNQYLVEKVKIYSISVLK